MAVIRRAFALWILFLVLITPNNEFCFAATVTPKKNFLCIGHLNICSLFGKIDLLPLFMQKHDFDIFGITETLLKESMTTPFIDIKGFNFERKDRGKGGGGVGVYLKTNIEYLRRQDLENVNTELICLEILSKHTKPFLLCILYRPPSSSKHLCKNYDEVFDNTLSKIKCNSASKEIIIIGDINCNYLDNNHEKTFKEMLALHGFFQKIQQPTRTTSSSQTLIDVILSNNPELLSKNEVVPCTLSRSMYVKRP